MASGKRQHWLVLVAFMGVVISNLEPCVHGNLKVPCYFIFGDSLFDPGNTNNLKTAAKANYPPYGVDFPFGPTGRFSNGRTMVDYMAQLLGFDIFIPPFTTVKVGTQVLKGVNYATGAAGIRCETGKHLGQSISFDQQLQNHQTTMSLILSVLGDINLTYEYLNSCIYSVGLGTHDYLSNYYSPQYNTSTLYTPEQYAKVLIDQYSQQLQSLHNYGARKVIVTGLGSLGCLPYSVATYGTNATVCVDDINNAVQIFNYGLKGLVNQLNQYLPKASFVYTDTLPTVSEVQTNSGDFRSVISNCCPLGRMGLCIPMRRPCLNRNTYLYWDAIHPTEAVNYVVATRLYNSLNIQANSSDPSPATNPMTTHLLA